MGDNFGSYAVQCYNCGVFSEQFSKPVRCSNCGSGAIQIIYNMARQNNTPPYKQYQSTTNHRFESLQNYSNNPTYNNQAACTSNSGRNVDAESVPSTSIYQSTGPHRVYINPLKNNVQWSNDHRAYSVPSTSTSPNLNYAPQNSHHTAHSGQFTPINTVPSQNLRYNCCLDSQSMWSEMQTDFKTFYNTMSESFARQPHLDQASRRAEWNRMKEHYNTFHKSITGKINQYCQMPTQSASTSQTAQSSANLPSTSRNSQSSINNSQIIQNVVHTASSVTPANVLRAGRSIQTPMICVSKQNQDGSVSRTLYPHSTYRLVQVGNVCRLEPVRSVLQNSSSSAPIRTVQSVPAVAAHVTQGPSSNQGHNNSNTTQTVTSGLNRSTHSPVNVQRAPALHNHPSNSDDGDSSDNEPPEKRTRPMTSSELQKIQQISKSQLSKDETECGICFEVYGSRKNIRRLTCQHAFHQSCIFLWLKKNSTCPFCRKELNDGK